MKVGVSVNVAVLVGVALGSSTVVVSEVALPARLGSLVSEIIAEHGIACQVVRCGVRATSNGRSGGLAYLYDVHGLSSAALVKAACELLHVAEVSR